VRHYVEMLAAMVVGMLLLEPVWRSVLTVAGRPEVLDRTELAALVMATDMTIGMSLWMRYRGHQWLDVAWMGAAMYVPVLVLLVPFRAGGLSGEAALLGSHLLMLPAMLAVMAARRSAYVRRHRRDPGSPTSRTGRVVTSLSRRWPTWLALVITVDHWINPAVPSPWILLGLPGAYLVIGAWRHTLGDRRVLAVQLAGFAAYLALVVIALSVDDDTARYLVAAGWIAHAGWDVAHHRARCVVPRWYAEGCVVFDLVIGITILAASSWSWSWSWSGSWS
jgi:hypothetical protein